MSRATGAAGWLRRALVGGAVAAAATVMVACGSAGTGPAGSVPAGGTASSGPAPGSSVVAQPGAGPAVPAAQLDIGTLSGSTPAQVWTQDDGRVVGLLVEQAGCQRVGAELGPQTPRTVTIVVVVTTTNRPGTQCPMIVRSVPVGVRLDAPLGDRTVVLSNTVRHG